MLFYKKKKKEMYKMPRDRTLKRYRSEIRGAS